METFSETFGFVAAVGIGIIVISLFFFALSRLAGGKKEPSIVKMKGFLKGADRVNIHPGGSKVLENVKLVGITDHSSVKGELPYDLVNMLVLEKEDGKRFMIKAKLINMIEEI